MASSTPGRSVPRQSLAGTQSPGSPTRLSRLQEKEELRHLNDRLAAYMERVHSLESDKILLRLQLEEQEEVSNREVYNLKLLYNTELADARKLLHQTANERARLQVDLCQLREEHRQLQARNGKKELACYQALHQVRDLESKLNAREAAVVTLLNENRNLDGELKDLKSQINDLVSSLRDTTKQLQEEMLWRVDLENKLQTLKEHKDFEKTINVQNVALEAKLRDLEEMLENAHDLHRRQMSEKEREVAEMRQQLQTQLDEYEQLLDVKLALDMEINTYRKMLEGEEKRLKLSPSPSQRSTVSRKSCRKKRKLDESERPGTSRGQRSVQDVSCLGPVWIEEVNPEGTYVKMVNISEEDQSLHGWRISRQHRSLPDIVYEFPGRFVLGAGQSVTIWAACAGAVHSPPSDLVWKSQICWGIGEEVRVTLTDSDGQECAELLLQRMEREEGDTDELCYEEFTESEFRTQSDQAVDPSCSLM